MKELRSIARSGLIALFVCLSLSSVARVAAAAEKYPSRPITFIVPWGAGGGADLLARTASKLMEPILGVSIPVVNVPGATGQTGLAKLQSSPADGYTIEVLTGDTLGLFAAPHPRFKLSDFVSLGIMILQPSGFYVKENSPWKSWQDLLKTAKTRTIKVATSGFGSPDDITINYFRSLGYHFENVPYSKPGQRYTAVPGGQTDVLYEQTGDVKAYVDGKEIRPIILFYPKPFNVGPFKGVPVSGQLGYHISMPQIRTIIVKKGTDPAIIKKLSDVLSKVVTMPEYKKYITEEYADPNGYMPAKKANEYMANWLKKGRKIIAESAHKGLNK